MIKEFSKKLDEVLARRRVQINNAKRQIAEAPDYKSQAKEVDDFLDELGIDTNSIENVYYKQQRVQDVKNSKANNLLKTEIIDKAISSCREKKQVRNQVVKELRTILSDNSLAEVRSDTALALVAVIESKLKEAQNYDDCIKLKQYLQEAINILINDAKISNDMCYAQWGMCIYDHCVSKAIDIGDELACAEEIKDAYSKFQKVNGSIEEIKKYRDCELGNANIEANLRVRIKQFGDKPVENHMDYLFEHMEGIEISLIRQYRYELLAKSICEMANQGKSIEYYKPLMEQHKESFVDGKKRTTLEEILLKYDNIIYEKKKLDIEKRVNQYIVKGKYRENVPNKYKNLAKSKYESKLKTYIEDELLKQIKNYSLGTLKDEDINIVVNDFFVKNESKMNTYVERDRVAAVKQHYKDCINGRIKVLTVIPDYAQGYMKRAGEYREELYELCMTDVILNEVEHIAKTEEKGYHISKKIVDKYINDAEAILKSKYEEKKAQDRRIEIKQHLGEAVRTYIKEKKYLQQIKSKYKNIDTNKYQETLEDYLEKHIYEEALDDDETVVKKALNKLADQYFDNNEEKFIEWLQFEKQQKKEEKNKQTNIVKSSASNKTVQPVKQQKIIGKADNPQKINTSEKSKKPKKPINWDNVRYYFFVSVRIAFIAVLVFYAGRYVVNSAEDFIKRKQEYDASDKGTEEKRVQEIIKGKVKLSPTANPASEFLYEVKNNYIVITKYNGISESVEIPAVIDGKNVCEIAREAFKDNALMKKVEMPDTIIYIRREAFMNCIALEEVKFSKNVSYMENDAFKGCSQLKSIDISSGKLSLKELGKGAFYECTSLENVNISTDIFADIVLNDGAFYGCSSLKNITVSGKEIKKLSINKNAFFDCKALTNINVVSDEDMEVIVGDSAFCNCESLAKVDFSNKITELGSSTFKNCSKLESFDFTKLTCVSREAFMNCTSLTKVHFPATMGDIQNDAFIDCTLLAEITFESAQLAADNEGYTIGEGAFKQTAVKEVDIPGQYRVIRAHAFASCPNLTKFVYRNSGKNTLNQELVFNVFYESYALKEVYLPKTIGGTMEDFRNRWSPDKMGNFTVYAAEGSTVYKYVTERSIPWENWTE